MLRKIRIVLAAVMFVGITLLFLDFSGTMRHYVGWMPRLQLLEAVLALNVAVVAALVVLTLVFGRIYCSVVCPLGVMQDIIAWVGRRVSKRRYSYSKELRWLRYPVLALFVVAALLGVGSVVQLLAPYSAYGRIAANVMQPVWQAGNNVLAGISEYYDSYMFYHSEVWLRSLASLAIALVTLVVIGVLAWRGGRTYCNTVCPVGTALSLLSRFSLFKVRFDAEKCRNCSMCSKQCKAACIDYKTHSVDASRCVACGDCLEACRFGALKYSLPKGKEKKEEKPAEAPDSSRRAFMLGTAALVTTAMAQEAKKTDGGLAELEDKALPVRQTPLTPPGSLSASNMARRCTGCQLCVTECPNQVLRPQTDLLHLMQPAMQYERGYCRPECNRCSEVCPAGAIKPISHEAKASTQIGHAVWIKKNCLPAIDGTSCGNCARHCPVEAIEMVPLNAHDDTSPMVPAVNEARCIGCGACEYLCPARPFSAIYVEGHEVHKEV